MLLFCSFVQFLAHLVANLFAPLVIDLRVDCKGRTGLCVSGFCGHRCHTDFRVGQEDAHKSVPEHMRILYIAQLGCMVIPVPDSMDDQTQFRAISLLLGKIEAEDTLSIDLSGGMRDTAMLLVTAARCMRDLRGVETRRVIYSELCPDGTSRIHDSSMLYNLFDLITAMDEFFSTGTAQKLKNYLQSEGENDPALHMLLTCINRFSDDLALCRVQALNEDLRQIAQALQTPPKESKTLISLFFHLLNDRFRMEFEGLLASQENDRRALDKLPELVSWCAKHGLYQQALTLLCEQMPEYICSHIFLQPTESGLKYLETRKENRGKPWVYPLFHFHFCRMALLQLKLPYTADLRLNRSRGNEDGNILFGVASAEEIHDYVNEAIDFGQLVIDHKVQRQVEGAAMLYQRVIHYRNQVNHANDTSFGLQSDRILPLDIAHIEQLLQDVTDYLQELRPMRPNVPQGVKALPVTMTISAGTTPVL